MHTSFPISVGGRWLAPLMLLALGALSACGSGGGGGEAPRVVTMSPGAIPYAAEARIPATEGAPVESVTFTVRTRPGGQAKDVRVSYARSWLERTGAINATTGDVTVPVFGLYADHDNNVEIDVTLASGFHEVSQVVVPTGPAPAVPLPTLVVDRVDPALGTDYLLLEGHQPPAIVDVDGAIRWRAPDLGEFVMPRMRTPSGMLVGSLQTNALFHVDWTGRTTQTRMDDARCELSHHTFAPSKNGIINTVTWQDGPVLRPHSVIAEMTPTGEIGRLWDLDEIFRAHILAAGEDPSLLIADGRNWFHMNAAIYDPSDDSIIASSRENFVVKLDYETGAIKWLLGNPAKFWFTAYPLSLQPLALTVQGLPPIGQHAPSMSADGRSLTLFDNGLGNLSLPSIGDSRTYSRVVTYDIDEQAGTATQTWTHDFGQAIYSPYCSSASWTPAGQMLIVCSTPSDDSPARISVVDAAGRPLFEARLAQGQCGVLFSAEALALDDLVLE